MKALICGVTGQDGAYLAQLLIGKGYEVFGTSRDVQMSNRNNLSRLGIADQVTMLSMAPTDFRSVLSVLDRARPDEIYALAGQTSVGLSFDMPVETLESIAFSTLNLLEAVRFLKLDTRIYHASSSECFGDLRGIPADETTPFRPRSPYGVAKTSAHLLVANYREAYRLYAANGLLFNHESPLRPTRFVTRKITSAAARIAAGSDERLHLGRLDIVRDWGWAPEYVDAMWRILQQDTPDDFVIATGHSQSLEDFVAAVFAHFDLDWRAHVVSDAALARPSDLDWSGADPSKAAKVLDWRANIRMPMLAGLLANHEADAG